MKAKLQWVERTSGTSKEGITVPDGIGVEVLEQISAYIFTCLNVIHHVYRTRCQRSLVLNINGTFDL